VVRKYAGYFRYDREEELQVLKGLYKYLRLYINFFQPVMKQISKVRVGSKIIKRYDTAKTPYQRLLESPHISATEKRKLKEQYECLNPAELHREIVRLQEQLIEMVTYKKTERSKKPLCHRRGNPCYAYV